LCQLHSPHKGFKNIITPKEAWSKIKLDVSHFHVISSETQTHIPDEKINVLQPKSEKCIFVVYFEDIKGYILLQPNSNEIIIRRDANFNEGLLAYELDSTFVPSLVYEPSLSSMPSSIPNFSISDPILVSSSDNDIEDGNPPLPTHLPPFGFIEHEHELALATSLSRWVHITREVVDDPTYELHTHS